MRVGEGAVWHQMGPKCGRDLLNVLDLLGVGGGMGGMLVSGLSLSNPHGIINRLG